MKNYKLWTAVITPMLDNGSVDFESLTKVCRQQMDAKNGLLILGSRPLPCADSSDDGGDRWQHARRTT